MNNTKDSKVISFPFSKGASNNNILHIEETTAVFNRDENGQLVLWLGKMQGDDIETFKPEVKASISDEACMNLGIFAIKVAYENEYYDDDDPEELSKVS